MSILKEKKHLIVWKSQKFLVPLHCVNKTTRIKQNGKRKKSLIEYAEKRAIISSKKYSTKEILDLSEQKTHWFDARTTLPNREIIDGEESHFSELKVIDCGGVVGPGFYDFYNKRWYGSDVQPDYLADIFPNKNE